MILQKITLLLSISEGVLEGIETISEVIGSDPEGDTLSEVVSIMMG